MMGFVDGKVTATHLARKAFLYVRQSYVPHSHGAISRNLSRSLISTYVPGRQ